MPPCYWRALSLLGLLLALVLGRAAWAQSAQPAGAVRIAFLSDLHIALQTNESGRLYHRHLDQAIAAVNQAKVDLVLIAGDVTDGGRPEEFESFKQQAQRFQAPVWCVAGNHDVGIAASAKSKASISSQRVQLYIRELGPAWFARETAGIRVIGLNSCLLDSGLPEEQEQWKFLEQELAGSHAKRTLLLEHYPLFLKTADEPPTDYWTVRPESRQRLLALLKQAEVKTILSGHLHYPITNRLDGTLFLGDTALAFGLPKGKQPVGWILLTVPSRGEVQFVFQRVEE